MNTYATPRCSDRKICTDRRSSCSSRSLATLSACLLVLVSLEAALAQYPIPVSVKIFSGPEGRPTGGAYNSDQEIHGAIYEANAALENMGVEWRLEIIEIVEVQRGMFTTIYCSDLDYFEPTARSRGNWWAWRDDAINLYIGNAPDYETGSCKASIEHDFIIIDVYEGADGGLSWLKQFVRYFGVNDVHLSVSAGGCVSHVDVPWDLDDTTQSCPVACTGNLMSTFSSPDAETAQLTDCQQALMLQNFKTYRYQSVVGAWEDEYEENDSRPEAISLQPGLYSLAAVDADWFAIDVIERQEVQIGMSRAADGTSDAIFGEAGVEFAVHRDGREPDVHQVPQYGVKRAVYRPQEAGTIYVRVALLEPGSPFYTLEVEVTDIDRDNDGVIDRLDNCPGHPNADQSDSNNDGIGDACTKNPVPSDPRDPDPSPEPDQDDAYEENDTPQTAASLAIGTYALVGLDQDWFKLGVTANQTLNLELTADSGDLDMYLADDEGSLIAGSATPNMNEEISYAAPADGIVYLVIVPFEEQTAEYTLSVAVQGTNPNPEPIPDDPGPTDPNPGNPNPDDPTDPRPRKPDPDDPGRFDPGDDDTDGDDTYRDDPDRDNINRDGPDRDDSDGDDPSADERSDDDASNEERGVDDDVDENFVAPPVMGGFCGLSSALLFGASLLGIYSTSSRRTGPPSHHIA